jgi:hypothetical protein
VALQATNGVPQHEKVEALLQKQSTAESEDSRRDALRLLLGRGESSQALQYGAVWEGHDKMIHGVRFGSLAGLRIAPGLSDKCKQFLCQSNKEVRQSKGRQTSGAKSRLDQDELMQDKDKPGGQTIPTGRPAPPYRGFTSIQFFNRCSKYFYGTILRCSGLQVPHSSSGNEKCLIQVQEMKMEQFRQGSYNRSKYSIRDWSTVSRELIWIKSLAN